MRASLAVRAFFLSVGFGSLALGYFGFQEYVRARGGFGDSPADLIYYDLQLLVLDPAPLDQGGPYPWRLEVARFGAPLATVYALAEAARALFADQWRRMVIRRLRGHALLCGDGAAVEILAARLLAAGERVVTVGSGGDARRRSRHFHLRGDARDGQVLQAAGIGRAKTVYAFSADSAANARIALTAGAETRKISIPLHAYVYVAEPELCQALRARRLGMSETSEFRLDFFNPAELAARVLLQRRPIEGGVQHIMIVGLSHFGRALVIEVSRRMRFLKGAQGPPRLTLVDSGATAIAGHLRDRYPLLGMWEIATRDEDAATFDLSDWSKDQPAGELPNRVFLCHTTPETALREALTSVRLWRGGPSSVIVSVPRKVVYGDAFESEAPLLEDLSGVLHVAGILDDACDPDLLGDDLIEQLGREIHEHHVLSRNRQGETEHDNPLLVPWHLLPEQFRSANRDQALHLGVKLRAIGCLLAPSAPGAPRFSFTTEEVERLAKLEHRRWLTERAAAGWTHGTVRDNDRKQHPSIVEWPSLPEEERQKDRDAVLALPDILADLGFQIFRR